MLTIPRMARGVGGRRGLAAVADRPGELAVERRAGEPGQRTQHRRNSGLPLVVDREAEGEMFARGPRGGGRSPCGRARPSIPGSRTGGGGRRRSTPDLDAALAVSIRSASARPSASIDSRQVDGAGGDWLVPMRVAEYAERLQHMASRRSERGRCRARPSAVVPRGKLAADGERRPADVATRQCLPRRVLSATAGPVAARAWLSP